MVAKSSSAERRLVELWLALRLFTAALASLFALTRPLTEREKDIPAWPPSPPYVAWIERIVFAPWERWDAVLFKSIVADGYSPTSGSTAFHPLFPWVSTPLAWLTQEPIVALWLLGSVFSLCAVIALFRLARIDLNEPAAEVACRLFLAFPAAAILFAPYAEPLWILCAAVCLLCMRQGMWWKAGFAAACATLTRQQGLFLIIPIGWELWASRNRDWRAWMSLTLAPAAYFFWIIYRNVVVGDGGLPDFSNPQSLLYSTLLSPNSAKVVPVQAMLPPWDALHRAIRISLSQPQLNNILDLAVGGAFLVLTLLAWRHMRTSYRLFSITIVLVSLAYHTGPEKPYMGLPRHLMLAIPVFIGAAQTVAKGARKELAAMLFMPVMVFLVTAYVMQAWVP